MGTTGGDRDALLATVKGSGNYAVIAPQMGKQLVAFQAGMKLMADQFPGAFEGYKLSVVESHQKTKVDTSGTAKAVVESFRDLGVQDFDVGEITRVRDEKEQLEMGVPVRPRGGRRASRATRPGRGAARHPSTADPCPVTAGGEPDGPRVPHVHPHVSPLAAPPRRPGAALPAPRVVGESGSATFARPATPAGLPTAR